MRSHFRHLNDHLERWHLNDRWFIDRKRIRNLQYGGCTYSLWEAGASPSGGAAFRCGHDRLIDVLDIAYGFGALDEENNSSKSLK